jgi:hypothetical protein
VFEDKSSYRAETTTKAVKRSPLKRLWSRLAHAPENGNDSPSSVKWQFFILRLASVLTILLPSLPIISEPNEALAVMTVGGSTKTRYVGGFDGCEVGAEA